MFRPSPLDVILFMGACHDDSHDDDANTDGGDDDGPPGTSMNEVFGSWLQIL